MRFATLLALAAGAVLLGACTNGPDLDIRTFTLENRSAYEAEALIAPYVFTDREGNPGAMSSTENAITVRETPDNLDKIARVLEDFDNTNADVQLHFQLIEADGASAPDPAISEVVEQLRNLFRFQGYRLIGEASVVVANRETFSQRFLMMEGYPLTISGGVQTTGTESVRLHDISLENPWDVLLGTSVTVAPGQTLVIGGGQDSGPDTNRTLILTVRMEKG